MNIKSIITEEINDFRQEKKYSPEEIYSYINKLHKFGWEKNNFDDEEWVLNHRYYILKNINIDDANVKWNFGQHPSIIKQYSRLETPTPPIVIASNGYIIDGTHRAGAVKQKGDTTIRAFVGIE